MGFSIGLKFWILGKLAKKIIGQEESVLNKNRIVMISFTRLSNIILQWKDRFNIQGSKLNIQGISFRSEFPIFFLSSFKP